MTHHRKSPLNRFSPALPLPFPLLLSLLLLFGFCKYAAQKDQPAASIKDKPNTEMPKPLPLPGDYAAEWKIVDSLESQGLFKSALEKTEAIQALATRDKNSPQVIKCLLYRGKYVAQLEEDGFVKAVQIFEKEEDTANMPEKAVLQSILAQLYAAYLDNQGWRISERTETLEEKDEDMLTWSAHRIEKRAIELYLESVSQEGMLKDAPVESFRDILSAGQEDSVSGKPLRPTLFDLLAHRALQHFANERSWLTEPAYAFSLDQAEAFAPAGTFVKIKFESRDSLSSKWLAVRLYQRVLAGKSPESEPAVAADLMRLMFVHNNSVLEDKDARYRKALEDLLALHKGDAMHAEVAFLLASHLFYQDGDAAKKAQNNRDAVALCEEALRHHPDVFGARQCRYLLEQIRSKSLDINLEDVCLPNRPALVNISYRNLDKVYVRVLKSSHDFEVSDFPQDDYFRQIIALPQVQGREWAIRNPGDYLQHSTEIALEALPLGAYILLVSEHPDFDPAKGRVLHSSFSVSNLAGASLRDNGKLKYVMAHRLSGAPLAGVRVDFYTSVYNRRKDMTLVESQTSDANGWVQYGGSEGASFLVRASLGQDTLWLGQGYHYRSGEVSAGRLQAHFFTDRSMYRPGQTVYFKGVLYQNDKNRKPQILPNQSVSVKFYDVNEQEKGRLQLRSNEFGTFNGAFAAPASGLTGQMHIRCEEAYGSAYFNVEEYKRPKFEVNFEQPKEAFRLGGEITAKGSAKAYAGSNVDGAEVRYRVVRQARFPFWDWGWKRGIFPPWRTDEMEIANGTAKTDAEGKFEVKFTAIPDRDIPKKDRPMFDYTVYADVTDITGETRSSQQTVTAGYVALQVDWGLSGDAELGSLDSIAITTSNLAGQPQAATGRITLQPLRHPGRFYNERYWEKPDITTISKEDWQRQFPDYARDGEDQPDKWEREDYVLPFEFNTASSRIVDLQKNVRAGYYLARLSTKDAYGETIEIERIVRIWDKNRRATQFETPDAVPEKTSCEPGETARIWLGGNIDRLNMFFAAEKDGALHNPRWLDVAGAAKVELPVTEADRGGMVMHWFAVKNNRFYGGQQIGIAVPWSNKDLSISFETFRDKLAPGQKEEWRIKIAGPKKEKVAAEMVAAMYDASLDQFLLHNWQKLDFPRYQSRVNFTDRRGFGAHSGTLRYIDAGEAPYPARQYHELNWFDFPFWGGGRHIMKKMMRANGVVETEAMPLTAPNQAYSFMHDLNPDIRYDAEEASLEAGNVSVPGGKAPAPQPNAPAPPAPVRRNLNETVFFYPELRTDKEGNIVLKFTMNEALTRWKLLTFAHTKDLQQAISVREVVTQKELMVLANPPRFLRAGDRFEFSAKVSNLSQETLNGTATLSLLDAATLQPLEAAFGLDNKARTAAFSAPAGQSAPLFWSFSVPEDFSGAVTWQIVADSKTFRDGEESTVPVVTNRMLVTETLPITVRGNQTKQFVFENLKNAPSGKQSSLVSHSYTLEFTSNPAWYAVQALPYLMEFPHECSEQVFSRFYANTLASSVVEKMPNIRRVYERWKGTGAMQSNLSKNQELKYALLEETPWVLDAQNEEQQKRNIALLFDMNRMADERERAVATLAERQLPNGAWSWFPGGQESWYITQHIAGGFGHLKQLGAFDAAKDQQAAQMLDRALSFCDAKIAEQYRELEKRVQEGKAKWDDDHLDGMVIHYLYTRSFFPQQQDKPGREIAYYLGQAEKHWLGKGLYQEGMLALALHRNGRAEAARRIVASLRERALVKEELGMYWPVDWGFYWYQLPVETQALMVEVFDEVAGDKKAVEELRIWLLKNKQTNRWESTKATAEAVYALLLHGDNWLNNSKPVQVSLGGKALKPAETEAGTGYFKEKWSGTEVKSSWSEIRVENSNSNIVWGAAYWQYFEDLDKIRDFQKTPLTIVKQLFVEENSPTGPVLKPLAEGATLRRGDRVKVRIEIRVDRAMEFVHLKDMRAAGFEPVNVLSSYRWQDGLGYYESTKDLATHFFIDYLPRGTFVFEYPLVVNHRGDMSNGVTTMQCMYAPEFTSHSKGVRVRVE